MLKGADREQMSDNLPLLAPKPDIFCRFEEGDKLLLVRSDGSNGSLIQFLNGPAPSLWKSLLQGSSLDTLLKETSNTLYPPESILATLQFLQQNHFISSDPVIKQPGFDETSIRNFILDPWQYQFSKPYLDSPWFALWELTDRCPLKGTCSFCYRPEVINPDPGKPECDRIIDQFVASKIPFVTLLGGEPLCHKDIFNIISRLRSENIYVKAITNGTLINQEMATKLSQAGLNQIAVSLDGISPEVNDLSRGSGSFKMVLSAIEKLQGQVPRISISLTISSLSLEQLESLPSFCAGLGIGEVYVSPLRKIAGKKHPQGISPLSAEQMQILHQQVDRCNQNGLKVIGLKECSCGRSSIVVHSDGQISPCPFSESAFGNIHQEDLSTVWARMNQVVEQVGDVQAGSFCFQRFDTAGSLSSS